MPYINVKLAGSLNKDQKAGIEELENQKVLILLGARQVGKSHLMKELEDYVLNNDRQTQFFNLEIPEDSRLFAKDKVELYKALTKNTDFREHIFTNEQLD